jgi:hypothetical protein
MKSQQMTRKLSCLTAFLGFVPLLFGSAPVWAQSAPSLGDAQDFAVLGGSTVTVAGTGTVITGEVGTSPGTSITGIPAGGTVVAPFTTHSTDAAAIAAQASTTALYTALVGTGSATALGMELGGQTLNPGTYSFSSTANIASGTTLTLDGAGVYIFKVGSAITSNVHSNVVLVNGASPSNVFWQVTSAATINGVTFSGTIVAQAAITLGVGNFLSGRALTTAAGAVTMAGGNTINAIEAEDDTEPVIYCTAKVNSLGCTPMIAASGVSSATSESGFMISCTQLINNKFGLLFYSDQGQNDMPFNGGTLCVQAPMRSPTVLHTGGNPAPNDCSGELMFDMNAFAFGALGGNPASYLTVPNTVVVVQFWARDNGFSNPNNVSLSDAVQYTVGP